MSKCLHPILAWKCGEIRCKSDGVVSKNLVFNPKKALAWWRKYVRSSLIQPEFGYDVLAKKLMEENRIEMPCNKCAACQIQKRKDMSVRLAHEASQFENCCFITLTYDEVNVPVIHSKLKCGITCDGEILYKERDYKTLCPSDVQKFMKRLRRHLEYVPKKQKGVRDHVEKVRYFAVGEYGGKTHRPHYHIVIFGWKPSDARHFKTHNGKPVFRSAQIEKCWKLGFSSFSDVNPYVAKYCARYVTKKFARLTEAADPSAPIVVPEFVLQSTRDGAIGATWFDIYGVDACKVGLCTLRVDRYIQKCSIPKYYWSRLRRTNLPVWLKCRDDRIAFLAANPPTLDKESLERYVDFARYKFRREIEQEYF